MDEERELIDLSFEQMRDLGIFRVDPEYIKAMRQVGA